MLLDLFLDKHGRTIDPATTRKLTAQLKHVRAEFSDRHPDSLRRIELEDWRELLGIRNPKRKRHERREVHPFELGGSADGGR